MDEKAELESEFLQLIMGLESSGWMTLGKITNPITGKMEKNLEAAKGIIDTLIILKEKTKGNLSKTEESVLNGALQNLQLNYVDESKKLEENKEEPKEKKEETKEEKTTKVKEEIENKEK